MKDFVRRLRGEAPSKPGATRLAGEPYARGQVLKVENVDEALPKLSGGEVVILLGGGEPDLSAAEALVAKGVAAVVCAGRFCSGEAAGPGAAILARSGVRLLEDADPERLAGLEDGAEVEVRQDGLYRRGGDLVSEGRWLDAEGAERRLLESGEAVGEALEAQAQSTVEAMRRERGHLFRALDLPEGLEAEIRGRHALVVARGQDHRRDLVALVSYVRDVRPYVIGVDGGADAVLEAGYNLDLLFGDLEAVSEKALKSAGRVLVHGYAEGHAPGRSRAVEAGLPEPPVLVALGLSEDVGVLIAEQCGAGLIVAVGTHAGLTEFMDKSRKGVSSTFLTRLKFGPRLVDARAVSELYPARLSVGLLVGLMTAGLVSVSAVVLASERVSGLFELVALRLRILLGL